MAASTLSAPIVSTTAAPSAPDQSNATAGPLNASEKARFNRVTEILLAAPDDENEDDYLAQNDLYVVSTESDIETVATDTSMITLDRPKVIYDNTTRRYYAMAEYRWHRSTAGQYWYYDATCNSADSACNVGGRDGFAMRFSRNLVNRSVDGVFCGDPNITRTWANFGCTYPAPWENSSAGTAYMKQDKVWKTVVDPDYNMFRGQITMAVDPIACGTTVQIFSKYGHTWRSTGLDSISVSTSGISMNFSSTNYRWQVASQSGTWTRSC